MIYCLYPDIDNIIKYYCKNIFPKIKKAFYDLYVESLLIYSILFNFYHILSLLTDTANAPLDNAFIISSFSSISPPHIIEILG